MSMPLFEAINLLFIQTSTNQIQNLHSTCLKCLSTWLAKNWLSFLKAWVTFCPLDLQTWRSWRVKSVKKHQPDCLSFLLEVDAHTLSTILRVRIHWVDTLSLHLDYNQATRNLSFFCFPSFCVINPPIARGGILIREFRKALSRSPSKL